MELRGGCREGFGLGSGCQRDRGLNGSDLGEECVLVLVPDTHVCCVYHVSIHMYQPDDTHRHLVYVVCVSLRITYTIASAPLQYLSHIPLNFG